MSGRRLVLLAAGLLLLPGCAVPLFPECGGWLQGERRCIDGKSLSFLVPGGTTKDDVIGKLGFPTRVLRNGTVYGYDWGMASWLFILAGAGGGAAGVAEKNHVLLIEFDADGRVVRHAVREGYFFPEGEFPKSAPSAADGSTER